MNRTTPPSRPADRALMPLPEEDPAAFARRMWRESKSRQRLVALGDLSARRCSTLVADALMCWDAAVEASLRRHTYAKVMSDAPGITRRVTVFVQDAAAAPAWVSDSLRAIVDDCRPYGWSLFVLQDNAGDRPRPHLVAASLDVAPLRPVADSATARAAALVALRTRRGRGRARLLRYLRSTGRFELAEAVGLEAMT